MCSGLPFWEQVVADGSNPTAGVTTIIDVVDAKEGDVMMTRSAQKCDVTLKKDLQKQTQTFSTRWEPLER
jgi:hypothetical protein